VGVVEFWTRTPVKSSELTNKQGLYCINSGNGLVSLLDHPVHQCLIQASEQGSPVISSTLNLGLQAEQPANILRGVI
jgi:hypothetical protein